MSNDEECPLFSVFLYGLTLAKLTGRILVSQSFSVSLLKSCSAGISHALSGYQERKPVPFGSSRKSLEKVGKRINKSHRITLCKFLVGGAKHYALANTVL
jgi:hypothetical protein